MTFLVGYAMSIVNINKRLKDVVIILFFLIPSLFIYTQRLETRKRYFVLNKIVQKEDKAGLLFQDAIVPCVLHRGYSLGANVIPLSKDLPSFEYKGHITYDILSKDGYDKKYTDKNLVKWFKNTNLNSFIYIQEDREKERVYDKNRQVKKVLEQSCGVKELYKDFITTKIYLFSDCF